MMKQNFYDFLKYRIFQKLATNFANRTKRQTETKACVVLELATRPYSTEQVQSILQLEISTHFESFRFGCKNLKFQ